MEDPNLKGVELSGSKKRTGWLVTMIAVVITAITACAIFFLLKQ